MRDYPYKAKSIPLGSIVGWMNSTNGLDGSIGNQQKPNYNNGVGFTQLEEDCNMNIMMGEVIQSLRKEKRMTQAELAEKVSVTGQAVSKWETGEANPDISLVPELAKVLGVSVGALFGEQAASATHAPKYSQLFASSIISFAFAFIALISLSTAFLMNWDKLLYSQPWIAISLGVLFIALILGVCLGVACFRNVPREASP